MLSLKAAVEIYALDILAGQDSAAKDFNTAPERPGLDYRSHSPSGYSLCTTCTNKRPPPLMWPQIYTIPTVHAVGSP